MRNLLFSCCAAILLGGCVLGGLPSGINVSNGCSQITGCQEKDYYLPGKGYWASPNKVNKAKLAAGGGAALGAYIGMSQGDPLAAAGGAVFGMFLGYEIGAHFDKIDEIHAVLLMRQTLSNNGNGQTSTWTNPTKPVVVTNTPLNTNGNCREFITTVQVGREMKKMRGTACLDANKEWQLKEIY